MKLRRMFATLITTALVCPTAARADSTTRPVVIYSAGPQRIRVRVAIGQALPCSSSSNQLLFDGPIEPGQSVQTETPQVPVCVEHTYGDFPDTEWSRGEWWPFHCGSKAGCQLPPVVRVVVSSNAD